MQVGFIGSGNMASALARGWGEAALFTDSGSGRAAALAAEVGGEAVASNRELAERADIVVLAHKPAQLQLVAGEISDAAGLVVSLLARTSQAEVQAAYPAAKVFRVEPNTPVEVRRGVCALAAGEPSAERQRVRELFGRVGTVVDVPEPLMSVAGACAGVGPAYWALVVEAWVDAAVRHGMPAALAARLVTETMAGSAELLAARGGDTLGLRRAVASPGGTTARGLAALEHGGVRAALDAALDAVVGA
jgi:pyrroline-5-carboxylate reductase